MLDILEEAPSGEDLILQGIEIFPGKVICGYEIISKLGVGGMGVVYEAVQTSLKRVVALKMVRAPSSASNSDMARFRQEAEAAARLAHPNIVEVYEIGEHEGTPFFTMRYVEGARPLTSEIARGPCEPRKAARVVIEIARAIAYAHQRGVIHRDLKPANILLDAKEHPSIVDFGLAKLYDLSPSGAESLARVNEESRLVGTPYYMSPEQIECQDLTTATDVYSLGIVLYELLSGSPPFQSKSISEIFRKVAEDDPKPPSAKGAKVDRDLEVICLKCLRKNPENRYGTADEFADDLERWSNGEPIRARPTTAAERATKWARRNPAMAFLGMAVVFLAVVTIILLTREIYDLRREDERRVDQMIVDLEKLELDDNEATKEAGLRWQALDIIADASQILKSNEGPENVWVGARKRKLQNKALYWLSKVDLKLSEEEGDLWFGDSEKKGLVQFSNDFVFYAHLVAEADILIRARSDSGIHLRLPCPIAGQGVQCRSIQFSPGERERLAAIYETGSGKFSCVDWNLEATPPSFTVFPANGPHATDFSSDGEILVVGQGSEVQFRHRDGDQSLDPVPLEFAPDVVRIDPDGEIVAAGAANHGVIVLYDLEKRELAASQSIIGINDLAWNPNGRFLAMVDTTGSVSIFDTKGDEVTQPGVTPYHASLGTSISKIAWHPRGVLLAGVSTKKVHLWHIVDQQKLAIVSDEEILGRPQFSPEESTRSHLGPVFLRDQSENLNGQISLLEVAEGKVVSHAQSPTEVLDSWWWSARGRLFSTVGADGVRIWNRRGFQKAFLDEEKDARFASFTDRSLIITSSLGVSIRPVTETTEDTASIGLPSRPKLNATSSRPGDLRGADYNEQRQELAVAAGDRILFFKVIDFDEPGRPMLQFTGEIEANPNTTYVAISSGGDWLASGTEGGDELQLWERQAGEGSQWQSVGTEFRESGTTKVYFYPMPSNGVGDHPAKEYFVTSDEEMYRFYELGNWEEPLETERSLLDELPGRISFSPRIPVYAVSKGSLLEIYAMADFDRMMATLTGQSLPEEPLKDRLLANPEFDAQHPVSFSPQGFLLMTTDSLGYLHLWDLRYLREFLREIDLDLEGLPPFPARSEIAEPNPPIRDVTVEESS